MNSSRYSQVGFDTDENGSTSSIEDIEMATREGTRANEANDCAANIIDKTTTGDADGGPVLSRCVKRLGCGMKHDLQKRFPLYASDWRDGLHPKILSAALLMYFGSIAPALTFGDLLARDTGLNYGVTEVLVSTAVSGVFFSLFAGQPIVIVGVTGPVTIFSITVYQLSEKFDLPFIQWMFWICLWSGIMHAVLALVNGTDLVRRVTRFSGDVFGVLIGVIYIVQAILDLVNVFDDGPNNAALLSLLVVVATFALAMSFHEARGWPYFNMTTRTIIADYGPSLTLVLVTGATYIGKLAQPDIRRISAFLPDSFGTTSERPWIVSPMDGMPTWAVFAAIVPALILTALFFFDHNVSSLLSQKPEFNLVKGSAYHWDFFCLGMAMILCGVLGIPPGNGLIPQAPLHTRALADIVEVRAHGYKKETYVHVREQRLSNLLQSVAIGLSLALLGVIGRIPTAVLSGFFLYMGFASFEGNQFAARTRMFITDHSLMPPVPYVINIPFHVIAKFTAVQLAAFGVIYGVTWTPAAISFPLFILLLVPLRQFVLPRYFDARHIELLDDAEDRPFETKVGDCTGGVSAEGDVASTGYGDPATAADVP